MNDIFMSYSSEDRERVQALVRVIEAQGFDVFWDRDITYGDSYRRVIDEALKRAKCAIVVWSRHSLDSEWVTNEASEARKSGILVPVLLAAGWGAETMNSMLLGNSSWPGGERR